MIAACLTIFLHVGEAAAQSGAPAPGILLVDYELSAAKSVAEPVLVASSERPAGPITSPALLPSSTPPAIAGQPDLSAWPLWALVEANKAGDPLDDELNCVAVAVYFEARGEPLEGQLAVAEVVKNRARSGRYPASYCAVVKQPAQFSFVRHGRFPSIKEGCPQWSKAQAIARVAAKGLAGKLTDDVLWYHADYVAPSWGRRLSRVEKIGAHIFYRS